jgi:hypothetical protein
MELTNEKINNFLKIIEETSKRDKSYPWTFPNMSYEMEDEQVFVSLVKVFIHIPECTYLGENSYDEYGNDCLLVENAVRYFEPLLKEVQRLRTLNQTMSNTLSKF